MACIHILESEFISFECTRVEASLRLLQGCLFSKTNSGHITLLPRNWKMVIAGVQFVAQVHLEFISQTKYLCCRRSTDQPH